MPTVGVETSHAPVRAVATAPDRAAIDVAAEVFLAGGNAVDAAAAIGLALTVTMPSRAGLGGGGACLVHDQSSRQVLRLDFPSRPASPLIDARWRAATPHAARGLFALHARAGRLPWSRIVAPSEDLARRGFAVSPTLAADIAAAGEALANDQSALALVQTKARRNAAAGDRLANPDLATTLSRMRSRGPGSFFEGSQARDIEDAAAAAGASVAIEDLRGAVPVWSTPAVEASGRESVARSGVGDTTAADVAYATSDGGGLSVACVLGMGRPFGLGIAARGHGFLFAAAEPIAFDPNMLAVFDDDTGGLLLIAAGLGRGGDGVVDAAATRTPITDALAQAADAPGHPIAILSCAPELAGGAKPCLVRSGPSPAGESVVIER